MPNIGVYTPTFVNDKGAKSGELYHVFNSIGYGFDNKKQPDHQFLMSVPATERASVMQAKYVKLEMILATKL